MTVARTTPELPADTTRCESSAAPQTDVARSFLAPDQGMIMMAIGNAPLDRRLQAYFTGDIEDAIEQEAFFALQDTDGEP